MRSRTRIRLLHVHTYEIGKCYFSPLSSRSVLKARTRIFTLKLEPCCIEVFYFYFLDNACSKSIKPEICRPAVDWLCRKITRVLVDHYAICVFSTLGFKENKNSEHVGSRAVLSRIYDVFWRQNEKDDDGVDLKNPFVLLGIFNIYVCWRNTFCSPGSSITVTMSSDDVQIGSNFSNLWFTLHRNSLFVLTINRRYLRVKYTEQIVFGLLANSPRFWCPPCAEIRKHEISVGEKSKTLPSFTKSDYVNNRMWCFSGGRCHYCARAHSYSVREERDAVVEWVICHEMSSWMFCFLSLYIQVLNNIFVNIYIIVYTWNMEIRLD